MDIYSSLLLSTETTPGPYPEVVEYGYHLCRMNTEDFPDVSFRSINLTTHLHLVNRLRINGALPLIPLYACMA